MSDQKKTVDMLKLFSWGGVPFSLALANLILYILDPKSIWWNCYEDMGWGDAVISILGGILMYAVFFLIIKYLSSWIERRSIFKSNILIHFLTTTAVVLAGMFLLLQIEDWLYTVLETEISPANAEMERALRNYFVANMIVAAFVNNVFYTFIFFERWKAEAGEANKLALIAQELKTCALQSELEVLKMQLDPHFLFNSFSILTQLIETNKQDAALFLEKLSKVYRYILTTGKRDIIPLDEELKFLFNYFHLIKIRQGTAVDLFVEISEADKQMAVPPVTLQLLVENAIKHNISTVKQPLKIRIESTGDGFLAVSNNLQRIPIDYKGTGLGLSNIRKRYDLLSDLKPDILETDDTFTVRLPLLNF